MEEDIERYNQAKADGTLDKLYPKLTLQNSPKGSCIFDQNTGLPDSPVSEELKKEWEREFDIYFGQDQYGGFKAFTQDNVKTFINFLLAKQQEEFVKKVKGMLQTENHDDYYYGYNDALNDLLEDFADIKSKLK